MLVIVVWTLERAPVISGVTHVVFGQSSVMVMLVIASGQLLVAAIVNNASSPG